MTAPADSPGAAAAGRDDDRVNILIVDDLPEKLLVFQTVLEDLGQNLIFARSGKEALREVLQREFAVILLDVNMPDIDGFETAQLIRNYQRSALTPIIFITSYADEMQVARGYSLGAVDYILSPVVPEILRSKVKVFVSLYALQRQIRRQADDRVAMIASEAARRTAEQNDRRSAFLAQASRVLNGSLDVTVAMRELAALIVPRLAPFTLLMFTGDGDDATVVLKADACGDPLRLAVQEGFPVERYPALEEAVRRCIADKRRSAVECNGEIPFTSRAKTPGPSPAMPPRYVGAAVPLLTGERVLGALLVVAEDDRPTDPDWQVLEDLAGRAATAFENARLYCSLQKEIVERRAAEAGLQVANRRKDEFLAMLSHELRNPLAPISAALEVIRRVSPDDPKFTWAADIMNRQLHQLTRLIGELLDVARISQDKVVLSRERVDLNAVVAQSVETVQPFVDARHQTLHVRLPVEPVWLQADFARLTQVISNLLHNASKYSREGNSIEIESSVDQQGAVISVKDHGIGIDADLLPRIFDLFAQGTRGLDRAQGGLGVGLTLARRLVELHGGRIEAFSAGANRGSEFRLHLPCLWVVRGREQPVAVETTEHNPKSRRVLIVDDNRDAAESIATLLQLSGHVVRTAIDGEQALARCTEFNPEIILLDIGLPLLDGYEVARRIRATPGLQQTLLIALTGYGHEKDRAAAHEAGFDHHFVKPVDPELLARCVEQWDRSGMVVPAGAA